MILHSHLMHHKFWQAANNGSFCLQVDQKTAAFFMFCCPDAVQHFLGPKHSFRPPAVYSQNIAKRLCNRAVVASAAELSQRSRICKGGMEETVFCLVRFIARFSGPCIRGKQGPYVICVICLQIVRSTTMTLKLEGG